MPKKSFLDFVQDIIRDAESQDVQIRLANPGKLRLVGPAEAVERIKPRVLEHKAEILEHLQSDPWAWHTVPTDPADKDGIEWWATIEHLKEILAYEGWALGRVGKTLCVLAEPWYTPPKMERLVIAVEGLRACWPVLVHRVEFFPAVAPDEASALLQRIERCHHQDGFKALGWDGLQYPKAWPISVVANFSPIYAQSLQTDGGLQ